MIKIILYASGVEKTADDYEIIIEDNGRGMSEKDIREKNRQLTENVMEKMNLLVYPT